MFLLTTKMSFSFISSSFNIFFVKIEQIDFPGEKLNLVLFAQFSILMEVIFKKNYVTVLIERLVMKELNLKEFHILSYLV